MGSTMKPVIFNERVASALKSWHNTAKKNIKGGRRSENTTPFSSRPGTPLHGTSPLHLLHGYQNNAEESLQASPRTSNFENEVSKHNQEDEYTRREKKPTEQQFQDSTTSRTSPGQRRHRTEHGIDISLTDFTFLERG